MKQLAYGVSKHAVIALMEALNNELALKGLTDQLQVSVLCPSTVASGIWDIEKQERNRADTENKRTVSPKRQEGLRELFLSSNGTMQPKDVATELLKGMDNKQFIIDSHGGIAGRLFDLRSRYILGGHRPEWALERYGDASAGDIEVKSRL